MGLASSVTSREAPRAYILKEDMIKASTSHSLGFGAMAVC